MRSVVSLKKKLDEAIFNQTVCIVGKFLSFFPCVCAVCGICF